MRHPGTVGVCNARHRSLVRYCVPRCEAIGTSPKRAVRTAVPSTPAVVPRSIFSDGGVRRIPAVVRTQRGSIMCVHVLCVCESVRPYRMVLVSLSEHFTAPLLATTGRPTSYRTTSQPSPCQKRWAVPIRVWCLKASVHAVAVGPNQVRGVALYSRGTGEQRGVLETGGFIAQLLPQRTSTKSYSSGMAFSSR
jgi:hypothetical protein